MATFVHMLRRRPIHHMLSFALGTRAKVGALRVLGAAGEPITQREVARRAAVQHRSMQQALEQLVALGIVRRTQGGRDYLVTLNPTHRLGNPLQELFRAERSLFGDLRSRLVRDLRAAAGARGLVSVVLFGSVARGTEDLESDVDVLALTADASARERCADRMLELRDELWDAFGARVNLLAYDLAEARVRWRRRQAPLPDIARDGVAVFGPPLREILAGG